MEPASYKFFRTADGIRVNVSMVERVEIHESRGAGWTASAIVRGCRERLRVLSGVESEADAHFMVLHWLDHGVFALPRELTK